MSQVIWLSQLVLVGLSSTRTNASLPARHVGNALQELDTEVHPLCAIQLHQENPHGLVGWCYDRLQLAHDCEQFRGIVTSWMAVCSPSHLHLVAVPFEELVPRALFASFLKPTWMSQRLAQPLCEEHLVAAVALEVGVLEAPCYHLPALDRRHDHL